LQAKKLVHTKDMERDEWLKHRRGGIGGSDAPAIAGLSRWSNPLSTYLDKISTEPPDEEENRFMKWGNILEPVIATEFANLTGFKVRVCNYILQHPEHKWMLANIDREVIDPIHGKVGLECKSASQYKAKEWEDDKTPDEYVIQCAHYMMVTGSPRWYLAVLIGGNDFQWRLIERDMDLERDLFKIESEFWQQIQDRTPPAIDGSPASDDILKSLYPQAEIESVLTLPDTFLSVFAQLEQAKIDEKEAEKRKKEAENTIKAEMGEFAVATCGVYQSSWSNVSTSAFDMDSFKVEQPELREGYMTTRDSRRFSFKKLKPPKEKKAA